MTVAVVGAGLAGLACAERLARGGTDAVVFDKSRGAGGRASTKRIGELRFDFGATCLRAKSPSFRAWVDAREEEGVLARWEAPWVRLERGGEAVALPAEPTWVGVPGMSALIRHAGSGLDVRYGARVEAAVRSAEGWWLELEAGREGPFRGVILATPAPQAQALVNRTPEARERFEPPRFVACWATLVTLDEPTPPAWGRAVSDGPLEVVSREHSKPGRPSAPAWVLQASEAWSEALLDVTPEEAGEALLAVLGELCGPLSGARVLATHRWRYARARAPWGLPCCLERDLAFGVCGDWCVGQDLEAAYLSGVTLAAAWLGAAR